MTELKRLFKATSICQSVTIEKWYIIVKEKLDLSWIKFSNVKSLLLDVVYENQKEFLYEWFFFEVIKGISKWSAIVKKLKEILADGNMITNELIENRLYTSDLSRIQPIIKFVY